MPAPVPRKDDCFRGVLKFARVGRDPQRPGSKCFSIRKPGFRRSGDMLMRLKLVTQYTQQLDCSHDVKIRRIRLLKKKKKTKKAPCGRRCKNNSMKCTMHTYDTYSMYILCMIINRARTEFLQYLCTLLSLCMYVERCSTLWYTSCYLRKDT